MDVRTQFDLRTTGTLLIEPARLSDIPGLLGLFENIALSAPAWRSLIADGTVVCARDSGKIVGYYLADHLSLIYEGERLHELRTAISVLCNRFKLDEEHIAFGAQTAMTAPCHLTNLRSRMLQVLLRNIGLRHHHLFTFCGKHNPDELETLLCEGWRCFQEEDDVCYLTLDVAKTLRRLASELVFNPRPAKLPLGSRAVAG